MTELAREISFGGVRNIGDIARLISDGIKKGMQLPYDAFLSAAAGFGDAAGARQVFEALAGVSNLEAQGKAELARDYRRVESWAIALMHGTPEAMLRPVVDPLAEERLGVSSTQDLGGGVFYAGKINSDDLRTLRQSLSATPGVRYLCYQTDGIAVMPLPAIYIETMCDAEIDFEGLLSRGIMFMGSSKRGHAFLAKEEQAADVFAFLGASRSR